MEITKYEPDVQEWIRIIQENCSTDTELTLAYCNRVIDYGKKTGDDSLIAYGYYYCGVVYYITNDGEHFYDAVAKALSSLNKAEEWVLMARCYNFLGIFSLSRGNAAIALDYYLDGIRYCRMADEDKFASIIQVNIGALNIYSERYADALEVLETAYDYFSLYPDIPNYDDYMVGIYENMAKAYVMQGKLDEAKLCFDRIFEEHKKYCDTVPMVTVLCTQAMYYHLSGEDEKCEANIRLVNEKTTANMPVMDLFDDYYDYCKMLLERDKKDEFWHILDIMEPLVESLGIADLHRRLLTLKLKYYQKYHMQAEYLQNAGLYFELSQQLEEENRTMMNNVLNLRKNLEQLNREKYEIEVRNMILREKSETDPLTGLSNRFRLNDHSEVALRRALKNKVSLAVEILDMDSFKGYNDCYGHQCGDACIQQVASAIKSMEEFGAFTARYGGDEFILIYEGITKEQGIEYMSILRQRVMDLNIEHKKADGEKIMTISQGMCWDVPVVGNRVWDFMHTADDMLYRIKQQKRNNYCVGNLKETEDQIIMSCL